MYDQMTMAAGCIDWKVQKIWRRKKSSKLHLDKMFSYLLIHSEFDCCERQCLVFPLWFVLSLLTLFETLFATLNFLKLCTSSTFWCLICIHHRIFVTLWTWDPWTLLKSLHPINTGQSYNTTLHNEWQSNLYVILMDAVGVGMGGGRQ